MKLLKEIKEVNGKDENGKDMIKRFTNFKLVVEVEGNEIEVPIQPVNFGNKQNRKYYQILSMVSHFKNEINESDAPF